jgi:hypothetical protein
MFTNNIKTTLRHLFRNRLFTSLNILGLAVGISSCWIIYQIINYEFSYDAQTPNKENIYKVVTAFNSTDNKAWSGGVSAPLYQGIREEITGLEYVVPVFYTCINRVEVIRNGNEIVSKEDLTDAVKVDKSYFNMLPYTWLAGNKEAFLSNPNSVVLTESRSKEYFPNLDFQDMLHQSVTYYGFDTVQRTVMGIVTDYDTPSEFTAKEFLALTDEVYNTVMWTNTNGSDKLYIQLKEGVNKTVLLEQINQLSDRKWAMFEQERGNALPRSKYYQLLSLPELHFATHVNDNGVSKTSKPVMYGLVGIGIFLLLLACINYVNLSLAQIPRDCKLNCVNS